MKHRHQAVRNLLEIERDRKLSHSQLARDSNNIFVVFLKFAGNLNLSYIFGVHNWTLELQICLQFTIIKLISMVGRTLAKITQK